MAINEDELMSTENNNNDNIYFQEIQDNSKNNKLVFFVGAGVSALSKYPSWKDLIDVFHKKLYGNTKSEYSSDEYLKIPQFYFDNHTKEEYMEKVKMTFNIKCSPNKIHDLIMMTNPRHILTTNYDTLLEEVATKFGKNYSVINSDDKVSSTSSNNYLLKVHGDFEHDNFVLKEDDYLNYSENFKLIDNLMKTVMSSNLVVFIGYSLGDYNIKLIQNWVKQVQGKTFIKPIFIYTGEVKLDDIQIKYFEKKGIKILDANNYIKGNQYEEKYKVILEKIINYKKTNNLSNVKEDLDVLYSKMQEIEKMPYVRYKDFKQIFNNDYYVDELGYLNKNSTEVKYIESYFKTRENLKNNSELESLCKKIGNIFCKNHIKGLKRLRMPTLNIKDTLIADKTVELENHYYEMESYILEEYSTIDENYRKAYYFFVLGNVEKSYELYTTLLMETKEKKDWLHYYLCQLNRSYVYRAAIICNNFFTGINGQLYFGKKYQIMPNSFLEKINREMLNVKRENLFNELPFEFRKDALFLKKLCSSNYYIEDFEDLYDQKYTIEKNCDKDSIMFGITDLNKVKRNSYDTINFTYRNLLLFSYFDEHKKYVRNAQISYLEGAYNEINRYSQFDALELFRQKDFTLSYFDFICIVKNFEIDDIQYLERRIDFKRFIFLDEEDVTQYIMRTFDYYKSILSKDNKIKGDKIIMYMKVKEEIKNIIYLSKYFINTTDTINYILDFTLNDMSQKEINVGKKFLWSYNLLINKNTSATTISLLEKYLIKHVEIMNNSENRELSSNGYFSYNFAELIRVMNNVFISDELSIIAKDIKPEDNDILNYFVSIYDILSESAKLYIKSIYSIDNIDKLKLVYEHGFIENFEQYNSLILNYLNDEEQWQKDNLISEQKVLTGSGKDIRQIGIWIILGLVKYENNICNYSNLNDEYHFLVCFNDFDQSKFETEWLLNYSDEVIVALAKNEDRRTYLIEKLDGVMSKSSNYKENFNKYFNIYKLIR